VGEIHSVSSPGAPDQADGHSPRPPVTIRQHAHWAGVVRLMVGPTTGLPRCQPKDAQSRLRSGSVAHGPVGCATVPGPAHSACAADCAQRTSAVDVGLRTRPSRAQPGLPRTPSWSRRGPDPSAASPSVPPGLAGPVARPHRLHGDIRFRRARSPSGAVVGAVVWADHDADHGLCVPIVTVVGGSWSVVGSGSAGCLKVSKYTF
jgi:hypothetical protein